MIDVIGMIRTFLYLAFVLCSSSLCHSLVRYTFIQPNRRQGLQPLTGLEKVQVSDTTMLNSYSTAGFKKIRHPQILHPTLFSLRSQTLYRVSHRSLNSCVANCYPGQQQ